MNNRFRRLAVVAAISMAVGCVFAAANSVQAQTPTVVHVRTADLKASDTANMKVEPVDYHRGGYYHSYYRAPYRAYYGGGYRGYYSPYRYYGGAYRAWYGNPYYSYWNYPYYGARYYGPSYYAPNYYPPTYYGAPYSAYYAPGPGVGVYVGPRIGIAVRRGSFYW